MFTCKERGEFNQTACCRGSEGDVLFTDPRAEPHAASGPGSLLRACSSGSCQHPAPSPCPQCLQQLPFGPFTPSSSAQPPRGLFPAWRGSSGLSPLDRIHPEQQHREDPERFLPWVCRQLRGLEGENPVRARALGTGRAAEPWHGLTSVPSRFSGSQAAKGTRASPTGHFLPGGNGTAAGRPLQGGVLLHLLTFSWSRGQTEPAEGKRSHQGAALHPWPSLPRTGKTTVDSTGVLA